MRKTSSNSPINKQILLVTGSPRSGTTWVGQALASAPRTAYLLEPFNVSRAECYFELPISRWYQRLDVASDGHIERRFAELFAGRRVASGEPITAANFRTPIVTLKQMALILHARAFARLSSRIVMKDPIALLSADWLARRFGAQPIITIRHPAAVVSSLRLKGWSTDFDHLTDQTDVVETFFPDIQQWIADHPRGAQDPTIYGGAILWRLFHLVILAYQRQYPHWTYVRHEDLSRDPAVAFRDLFRQHQLPFTAATERFLASTTQASPHATTESIPTNNVFRNSAQNIDVWKHRLTESEVHQIRELTSDVAANFYDDGDW